MRTRIEAEEVALETAAMVVASTSQEVEQQYEIDAVAEKIVASVVKATGAELRGG